MGLNVMLIELKLNLMIILGVVNVLLKEMEKRKNHIYIVKIVFCLFIVNVLDLLNLKIIIIIFVIIVIFMYILMYLFRIILKIKTKKEKMLQ